MRNQDILDLKSVLVTKVPDLYQGRWELRATMHGMLTGRCLATAALSETFDDDKNPLFDLSLQLQRVFLYVCVCAVCVCLCAMCVCVCAVCVSLCVCAP